MMAETLTIQLEQFLHSRPYHAAFLIVHPDMGRLSETGAGLRDHYQWPTLSLSVELSQHLHDLPPQRRPSRIPQLCANILRDHAPGPLLCADIPLLFEPEWRIDPLRLLLEASKSATLIIAWPGTYQGDALAYAVPAHAHYRVWSTADIVGQVFQLA